MAIRDYETQKARANYAMDLYGQALKQEFDQLTAKHGDRLRSLGWAPVEGENLNYVWEKDGRREIIDDLVKAEVRG